VGTPAYMSPEQASDRPVDARSDIYALGVILYQLLAGRLPFGQEGASLASVLYQHAYEPPPRVANIPTALQRVLDRALAKDPAQRYPRAGDLAAELDRAVSAHPVSGNLHTPT